MESAAKFLTVSIICISICGCDGGSKFPQTYPVTGKVTVNGKAIEGAIVTFKLEDGKENAMGTTDSKGEFTLSMFQPGDGAVPGTYRITVSKLSPSQPSAPPNLSPGQIGSGDLPVDYAPPTESKGTGASAPKSEIPAKFSSEQTSGLRATVVEGPNNIPLDLKT